MGNGYPTLPCATPTHMAGPGCHFGNPTQPAGGFLFCDRKKLPKMAVSSHFRPFCDQVLSGRVFGWQPDPPVGCQVGGLPEPKPGPTQPIAQPSCQNSNPTLPHRVGLDCSSVQFSLGFGSHRFTTWQTWVWFRF